MTPSILAGCVTHFQPALPVIIVRIASPLHRGGQGPLSLITSTMGLRQGVFYSQGSFSSRISANNRKCAALKSHSLLTAKGQKCLLGVIIKDKPDSLENSFRDPNAHCWGTWKRGVKEDGDTCSTHFQEKQKKSFVHQ